MLFVLYDANEVRILMHFFANGVLFLGNETNG
jgi:hypothetical protein